MKSKIKRETLDRYVFELCRKYKKYSSPVYNKVVDDLHNQEKYKVLNLYQHRYVSYLVIKELDGYDMANRYVGEQEYLGALNALDFIPKATSKPNQKPKTPQLSRTKATPIANKINRLGGNWALYLNPDESVRVEKYTTDENLFYKPKMAGTRATPENVMDIYNFSMITRYNKLYYND